MKQDHYSCNISWTVETYQEKDWSFNLEY